MNKNVFWLLILFILCTYSAYPEGKISNAKNDSLRREINNKKGSEKISTQLELALNVMETDKDEAKILANSALLAAKTAKNKNLEMRAFYVLGRIYQFMEIRDLSMVYFDSALAITEVPVDNWYKGAILYYKGVNKFRSNEEIEALEYFNASLLASRLSNNFKILGASYSVMGTIFRINGLYDRAIEYIVNSRLNYEKAGSLEGNAWAAYLLGRIYADLKLPQKALEYFHESLNIYLKQASTDGNNSGVAICYEQIGLMNLELGNLNEAHEYINKTHTIFSDIKSDYGLSNSHKNLGIIEYSMGNYDLAEKYLNESLEIKIKVKDLLSLPTIYEYLGLCLIKKSKISDGFNYLQKGLDLAIKNDQKKIQQNIYSKLTEAYMTNHDYQKAIDCQKKQIEIQDQILSGAANIKIEQLQAIYEIDKKNNQIIELEKQNEINSLVISQHKFSQRIMILGIFIAFLFSLTIYWFYNKIRHKNIELREANAAKDKFFAIISHDLRGPTGNLASFLEHINEMFNEYRPEELKEILITLHKSAESVSVLLENLLIWAQSQLNKIEFRPAVLNLSDTLKNSVKGLVQTADNKQIDIKFELDDQLNIFADPNMVQTIVRNILSNAIKFTHRGGSVIIRSSALNTGNALINIIDNGIGIEKSALSKIFDITNTLHNKGTEDEKSAGLGLILVKDFIQKNNGTITIESQKNKGTTVSITLPLSQRS